MSSFSLGRLPCREFEDKTQTILLLDKDDPRFTPSLLLPPEILGEIFTHCLEQEMLSPDPKNAPLLLYNVCRRWREVALSTPSLWGSLAIHFPSHQSRRNTYQNWLSRARNAPLTIFFEEAWEDVVHSPDSTVTIPTLLESSPQWRSLKLALGPGLHLIGLLFGDSKEFSPTVPFLEELTLSVGSLPHHVSLSFRDIPKLRHFTLDSYRPEMQVPWRQLTMFRCAKIIVQDTLEILRNSCNLVDCSLRVYHRFQFPGVPADSRVDHPRLESLAVDFKDRRTAVLLDRLNAPALKSLTIRSVVAALTERFLSFISHSSIQLHTLTIISPLRSDAHIVECLKATPSLVHLKVSVARAQTLFAQLIGQPDFLPKLESLHIILDAEIRHVSPLTTSASTSLVVGLLHWRWTSQALLVAQLRSFRLVYPPSGMHLVNTLQLDPEVHRLQTEGMVVSVESWDGTNDSDILFTASSLSRRARRQ